MFHKKWLIILALHIQAGLFITLSGCATVATSSSSHAVTDTLTPFPTHARYAVGFSPKGGAFPLIIDTINQAQESILVASYSFTSRPIAQALIQAHQKGVSVRLVADYKSNANDKRSAVPMVAAEGIPVRLNKKYAIFHHKFMVIDGMTLETGSFNYSDSADKRNAENVLVITGAKELAKTYADHWQYLWNEGIEVKTIVHDMSPSKKSPEDDD